MNNFSKTDYKKLTDSEKNEFMNSDGVFFEQSQKIAYEMNSKVRTLMNLRKQQPSIDSLEFQEFSLEDNLFLLDSTSWTNCNLQDTKGNSIVAKVNPEGDVWEVTEGVQLFTPISLIRETRKLGIEDSIMDANQAQWLVKNSPNKIPDGCIFSGFLDTVTGKVHFTQEQACYLTTTPSGLDQQKALFCTDISTVDEAMRDYVDEMVVGDYDIMSAMQVRLIKKIKT